MPVDLDDPVHWRRRAAEVRALAAKAREKEVSKNLREIAESYDRLADLAERRQNTRL